MPRAVATGPGTDSELWFAVWTRNQCEPKVESALERKGLHVFLPRLRVPSRRRDRRVVLEQPLFPGYLFLRFTPSRESYIRVAGTQGVVRVLGERWDALDPVPDEQVEAVRRVRAGDRVRIVAGPLVGLEGFVREELGGRATFVVSVDLLRRSVGVEVRAEALERA